MIWGFKMIRYNKKITIKETSFGKRLETDRGEQYEIMPISHSTNDAPITTWWDKQAQTNLRRDQLDFLIKEYWRQHNPLDLYMVFKKGEGYSQPHDIVLAHDPQADIWILSTSQHTWFEKNQYNTVFHIDNALGPIEDAESRKDIFIVIDNFAS